MQAWNRPANQQRCCKNQGIKYHMNKNLPWLEPIGHQGEHMGQREGKTNSDDQPQTHTGLRYRYNRAFNKKLKMLL